MIQQKNTAAAIRNRAFKYLWKVFCGRVDGVQCLVVCIVSVLQVAVSRIQLYSSFDIQEIGQTLLVGIVPFFQVAVPRMHLPSSFDIPKICQTTQPQQNKTEH
eukprot:GHVT01013322.1.p1 GENE.GHVT01013322.1~~GHVT01013322.1.p1  ORF type:complete len:103 (-),score=6.09 GHVT01013322.1:194-502(-)